MYAFVSTAIAALFVSSAQSHVDIRNGIDHTRISHLYVEFSELRRRLDFVTHKLDL